MTKYKNIITGYENERRDGSEYLVLNNVSDKDITIPKGEKIYLNKTASEVLQKYPKVPHFTKSEKIEDQEQEPTSQEVANDVPW